MRYASVTRLVGLIGFSLLICGTIDAQGIHMGGIVGAPMQFKAIAGGESMARLQNEQLKMQQQDRQKKILEDTDRLLMLAQQLKDAVDKTNKDTLSLDVLKQAEQIERLAKSVRERMKN